MNTNADRHGGNIDVIDAAGPLDDGLRFPGHGLPQRPEQTMTALQPFARLTRDQLLGKKAELAYSNVVTTPQPDMVDLLNVGGREGSDLDACNMCVTLARPRVIRAAFSRLGGVGGAATQNSSGSYDNAEIGVADFPGTNAPIAWVPITAIIDWGIGGHVHRAYVDMSEGATINLTASWVRVHAAVAPDAANVAPVVINDETVVATSAIYEVAANIGPGWTRPGVAQRTVFLGSINATTESAVFAVPPFARKATIITCDPEAVGVAPPALTAAYLRFWRGPTGVTAGGNVGNYFQSGNQPIAFDVPNGGAYFSVQSGMGAAFFFAVIFELAV